MNGKRDFTPRFKTITPPKPKKGLSKVRKTTGEMDFFKVVMAKRMKKGKLYSEISGEEIQNAGPMNFHHALPKSKYPNFRLEEKNIVVVTDDEHWEIHNGTGLKENPMWKKYFEKVEVLKQEYNPQ